MNHASTDMHEGSSVDLSASANDQRDEASSISTHLTGKDNKSEVDSASEFQIGDLVWARGDDSFPYYPACICPSYFINTTPRRRKFTVFLYGSDVFDFVSAKNVRRFELFRDEMLKQELEVDMVHFFHHAVSVADEQAKLVNEARIDYIRQSQNISESLNDEIDFLLQPPKPKPIHDENIVSHSSVAEQFLASSDLLSPVEEVVVTIRAAPASNQPQDVEIVDDPQDLAVPTPAAVNGIQDQDVDIDHNSHMYESVRECRNPVEEYTLAPTVPVNYDHLTNISEQVLSQSEDPILHDEEPKFEQPVFEAAINFPLPDEKSNLFEDLVIASNEIEVNNTSVDVEVETSEIVIEEIAITEDLVQILSSMSDNDLITTEPTQCTSKPISVTEFPITVKNDEIVNEVSMESTSQPRDAEGLFTLAEAVVTSLEPEQQTEEINAIVIYASDSAPEEENRQTVDLSDEGTLFEVAIGATDPVTEVVADVQESKTESIDDDFIILESEAPNNQEILAQNLQAESSFNTENNISPAKVQEFTNHPTSAEPKPAAKTIIRRKDRMSDASTLFGGSSSTISAFEQPTAKDESVWSSPNNSFSRIDEPAPSLQPTLSFVTEDTDSFLSNSSALPLPRNRSFVDASSLFDNVNASADPFALPAAPAPIPLHLQIPPAINKPSQLSTTWPPGPNSISAPSVPSALGIPPAAVSSHNISSSQRGLEKSMDAAAPSPMPTTPTNPYTMKKSPSSQALGSMGIPAVPGVKYVPPQVTLPPDLSRSASAPMSSMSIPSAVTMLSSNAELIPTPHGFIPNQSTSSKSDTAAEGRKLSPVPPSTAKPPQTLVSFGAAPPSIPGIPSRPSKANVNAPMSMTGPPIPSGGGPSSIPAPTIFTPTPTQQPPTSIEPIPAASASQWQPSHAPPLQQGISKPPISSYPPHGAHPAPVSQPPMPSYAHVPIPNFGAKQNPGAMTSSKPPMTDYSYPFTPTTFSRQSSNEIVPIESMEQLAAPQTVPNEAIKPESTLKTMSLVPPSIHGVSHTNSSNGNSSKTSTQVSPSLPPIAISIPTAPGIMSGPPPAVPFTKSPDMSHMSAMNLDSMPMKTLPPAMIPSKQTVSGIAGIQQQSNRGRFPSRGCPVVSFGFGGKIVVMIPQVTQPLRPMRSGPMCVFSIREILKSQSSVTASSTDTSSASSDKTTAKEELTMFLQHLDLFPGPLVSSKLSTGSSSKGANAALEQSITNFINQRIEIPITTYLSDEYFQTAKVSSRSAMVSSERSIWSLLQMLLSTKGSVSSLNPDSVPSSQSPESKIIKLLLGLSSNGAENESLSSLLPALSSVSMSSKPSLTTLFESMKDSFSSNPSVDDMILIENLLTLGQREEAIDIAIQKKLWPLAFLISSISGAQVYQRTVQQYVNSTIIGGTPLHILSLIYSNQVSLLKSPIAQSASNSLSMHSAWRRILAGWLTNKGHDWEQVGRILGDRIHQDEHDVMACDIFYICAKCLPSLPLPRSNFHDPKVSQRGKYNLLGSLPLHEYCSLIDPYALSSLRMTEIFEYALNLGAVQKDSSASNASASTGTLSGWFGFGGGSSATVAATAATTTADAPQYDYISTEQLTQMKATLCFSKIRFAFLLADLGYYALAMKYAVYVKEVAVMLETRAAAPTVKTTALQRSTSNNQQQQQSSSSHHHEGIRPFKKKFVQDVDDFIDRLHVLEGKVKSSSSFDASSQQSSSADSSKWGISSFVNVLSSSTLKELVDGSHAPDVQHGSSASKPGPAMPNPTPPQFIPQKPQNLPPTIPGTDTNASTVKPLYAQPTGHPPVPMAVAPSQPMSVPYMNPNPPPSVPFMNQNDPKFPRSQSASNITSSTPAQASSYTVFQSQSAKAPEQYPRHPASSSHMQPQPQQQPPQQPQQQPPQQHFQRQEVNDKKAAAADAQQPPASPSAGQAAASSGLFGKIKKNIVSWLHPDAHSADENLGDGLKAYFDKSTGRWVFPGEVRSSSSMHSSSYLYDLICRKGKHQNRVWDHHRQ
jgi:hypothetical protein